MRFFLSFLLLIGFGYAAELDYSRFSSPEELIAYEESRLQDGSLSGEELAEAYLDLGESYLLSGNFEFALQSLSAGYELARNCEQRKESLFPRALLGLSITYANLGLLQEFYSAIENMQMELNSHHCTDCEGSSYIQSPILRVKTTEPPILGPDHISIQDCLDRVKNTAKRANDLISFVPRVEVQFLLRQAIEDLECRASNCCRAGGVWKMCLRPIVNKWYNWNEKWKLFKIPPDPAWD